MVPQRLSSITQRIKLIIAHFFDALFIPRLDKRERWFVWGALAAIYLAGIFIWVLFFNRGNVSFSFHDWHDITAPRLTFLQDAVRKGVLPLHISETSTLNFVTDRYLAIPDAFVAPQSILLRFMSVKQFIMADVLLMYTLGFAGLLWLKRRFSWSIFAFGIVFMLFNLNGHLLAHYAVGHFTWGGYFLFPWFVGLIFQLVEGERSWAWVAKISLVLFAILIQGSYHQFIYSLILLALIGLFNWKLFTPILKAGFFSGMLAFVRLLPPSLELGKFNDLYLAGYPSLDVLWQSLVTFFPPGQRYQTGSMRYAVGYWELTLYIGLAGVVFLLFFGIYQWFKSPRLWPRYYELALPLAGLSLFSMDKIYLVLRSLQIPLLDGERVASRILILPFLFLLVLAASHFQRWMDGARPRLHVQLGALIVLLFWVHDLWENMRTWGASATAHAFDLQSNFSAGAYYVVNHPDRPYEITLIVGAVVSVISLLALGALVWREKKQDRQASAILQEVNRSRSKAELR